MWLCFTLGIWTQLSSYALGHRHVIHFSVQVALKLPLSGTHHNRIDLQSFKQELVKMMLFFQHLFYQNLHFSSIHLEITCQSMPKYIEEMERTSSVLSEGEKTWLICQIKFLSNLNLSMLIDTRGIGHNLQDIMLKKTKNKEVLKAGFIAYLQRLGFSSWQIVFKMFDNNQ